MKNNLVLKLLSRTFLVISLVVAFLHFQLNDAKASVNCDIYTETDLINAFGDHINSLSINL